MPQVHHPHRPLHPDRPSLWQPVLRIVSLGGMMAGGYPLFLLLVNYAFWADRPLRALCCLLPCMAAGFLSFFLSRSLYSPLRRRRRPLPVILRVTARFFPGALLAGIAAVLLYRLAAPGLLLVSLPLLLLLCWVGGALLQGRPYHQIYRQQDLMVQVILHFLALIIMLLAGIPCRAEPLIVSLLTAAFFYGLSANQGNLDYLMERRGHDLSHLPPKIRRYNVRLLVILYAVIVLLLCGKDALAQLVRWVIAGLYVAVSFLAGLLARLFSGGDVPVEGGGPSDFSDLPAGEPDSGNWFAQVFTVILALVLLAVFLRYLPRMLRLLSAKIRALAERIRRFFHRETPISGPRGEENGEYTDVETDLQQEKAPEPEGEAALSQRRAQRRFRSRVKAFDRMEPGAEKEREGYRLLLCGMKLRHIPVSQSDTPLQTAARVQEVLSSMSTDWADNARIYSEVRYGENREPDTAPVSRLLHGLLQMKPLPEQSRGRLL